MSCVVAGVQVGEARQRTIAGPLLRGVLVLLLAPAGCGYHLAGEHMGLPTDVHSVSVGTIVNHSREHGLEKTLAFALEREIHERGQLRMEQDPGGGDAVLSGAIHDVVVRPVAYDAADQAVQYEIVLTLDLALTRQSDGHVLWRVHRLRESDEYSASASVVVTSSSQFQQGSLDAANIQSPQLSSIQLAETERRRAITRLLRQAVRDVYNQMVEDF